MIRLITSRTGGRRARWSLASLRAITSSGVTWSPETKRGLLNVLMEIVDASAAVCPTRASVAAHLDIARSLRELMPAPQLQDAFPAWRMSS